MAVLHCFSCRKKLTMWADDHSPIAGTNFVASGNYGSAVFDPEQNMLTNDVREQLVITVCDDCLTAASQADLVEHLSITPKAPIIVSSTWRSDPGEPE